MKNRAEKLPVLENNRVLGLYSFFTNPTETVPEGIDEKISKAILDTISLPEIRVITRYFNSQLLPGKPENVSSSSSDQGIFLESLQAYQLYSKFIAYLKDHPDKPADENLLNLLRSGSVPSNNPTKAFNVLMTAWRTHAPMSADAYLLREEVKEWKKRQWTSKKEEVAAEIEEYFQNIQHTLANVPNPLSMIGLASCAWSDSPAEMLAFVRWLRSKGKTPEEIVASDLLKIFFRQNSFEIGTPDSAFNRFYQLMASQDDLKPIVDQANECAVDFDRVFEGRSLTGKLLAAQKNTPLTHDQPEPKLLLPNPHDFKAYFKLFGSSYLMALLNTSDNTHDQELTDYLNRLSTDELANVLHQGTQHNSQKKSHVLSIPTIKRLLDEGKWVVSHFISQDTLSCLDGIDVEKLKREAPSSLDGLLLLTKVYQHQSFNAEKESLYDCVLEGRLAYTGGTMVSDSPGIDEIGAFLKQNAQTHATSLARVTKTFNEPLSAVMASSDPDLTQEDVHQLQDAWSYMLPRYNQFKVLFPKMAVDFPRNKYLLNLWMIRAKLSRVGGGKFDLKGFIQLLYGDGNGIEQSKHPAILSMLTLVLADVNHPVLRQQAIQYLQAAPFNVPNIFALQYEGKSLIELAITYGNTAIVEQWLSGDNKPRQQDVGEALFWAARHGHIAIVEKLLSLTGDNRPHQQGVNHALVWAAQGGHIAIVEKLLSLTGDNRPSQEGVDGALEWAAKNGHIAIVETLLSLRGDNKLSQYAVDDTLGWAARNGHIAIIEKLLSLTSDNKPSQKAVNSALKWAAEKGHIATVEKLLSLTGDNKLSQEGVVSALRGAARSGHIAIVEKLLSLRGDNKLSQYAVDEALMSAALSGRIAIVEKLLSLTGGNKPSKKGVDEALKWAATNGHIAIVEKLLSFKQFVDGLREEENAQCSGSAPRTG